MLNGKSKKRYFNDVGAKVADVVIKRNFSPGDEMFIHPHRTVRLNNLEIGPGGYVLYWMQQSQRAEENHALEYALDQANRLDTKLLVGFGLMDDYPEANLRHYTFMVEGLKESRETLRSRGIGMGIYHGNPAEVALYLGRRAALIVCDRGYLPHQKAWRREVAEQARCRVIQVESDVVVPVDAVSDKSEYAARTIRPKIHRCLEDYLIWFEPVPVKHPSLDLGGDGMDLSDPYELLNQLKLDRRIPPVSRYFKGGTSRAKTRLNDFILHALGRYVKNSNQPQTDDISHLSPYLHFGQISPLYVALKMIRLDDRLTDARDAFFEQLIVRRELAMNFVQFNPEFDSMNCLPRWARETLELHAGDQREYIYTRSELESAKTHDVYWNAAMKEMKLTGFMHNYMRMYWGKKILEWSSTPETAFENLLSLNNTWFLDGRDPNSYAGAAWIFGVHDRAWGERAIFGKVRYMAASGLERKCDVKGYVKKIDQMIKKNQT